MSVESGRGSVRVGVVQLGARNHYLTARVLHAAGMLEGLYTDAYAREGSWKTRLAVALAAGNPDRARVVRGRKANIPDDKVRDAWSITARALLAGRLPVLRGRTAQADAALARALARFAVRKGVARANAVYGYSSACPELFRWARVRGVATVLEQASTTVATSERIMRQEHERWPGWAAGGRPDVGLYEERQGEELGLANFVCAPSHFVKRSLLEAGVPDERIEVIPYGFDVDSSEHPGRQRSAGERLRVLYLGNVTLQKGIPYLLEAARTLGARHFEFRVVGPIALSSEKVESYRDVVEFTGRIPRGEVIHHYDWADVFVLPTLCDGFGMVQLEACARGLPMIVTPCCGEVVADGVQGFIVPAADERAIAHRLQALRDSPTLLGEMSQAACRRAREFSVESYGSRLVASLRARMKAT